jgi:nucleotide-binding universal stress UspA family protein
MEKVKHQILVPHDFTPVANNALEHALVIAKVMDNAISLIHIVKEESEIEHANEKCKEIAEKTFKDHFIKPHVIVREGTIFTTIADVAKEINANLVIMGTHGLKGMQKLTGSWALKVIIGSPVPFVIVQDKPRHKRFEKVVFPIDFRLENKEKNHWVNYLYSYYKAKFFIIKQDVKDKSFKARVQSNLSFAKKFFDGKGIDYELYTAPGKTKFWKETIKYAQDIEADLLLIMTTRDINVTDYILGADEQKIIANSAKIPVMCINPRVDLHRFGGFSAMGG